MNYAKKALVLGRDLAVGAFMLGFILLWILFGLYLLALIISWVVIHI